MKAINLINAVKKLGGTATLKKVEHKDYKNEPRTSYSVEGELNGYDVHMIGQSCSFFTTRRISDRGHFDAGSDYNSGGYAFYNRIKDLEYATDLKSVFNN